MKKRVIPTPALNRLILCLCLYLGAAMLPVSASEQAATEVVDKLHQQLLASMKNPGAENYAARYQALDPFIENYFDLELIAKVILSRYWGKFSPQQQQQFVQLFRQLTTATYASRFNEYNNETFVTNSVEQLKKGRLLVKTSIQSEGEDPVSLDYLMHTRNDRWMIISVVANGVNDLSLKRAEYGTIIKDQGYDALIMQIKEKISQYEKS